jgi:hypothetical protein
MDTTGTAVGTTARGDIIIIAGRIPAPEVEFRRRRGHLIVLRCPYCGGRHYHGVGGGFGGRRSDCLPGGQYQLTPRRGQKRKIR